MMIQKRMRRDMGRGRRKAKRQRRILRLNVKIGIGILIVLTSILFIARKTGMLRENEYWELSDGEITAEKPEMEVDLLDINEYSRPGTATEAIQGIVIHYTANPGTTAKQNRDYFNGLKDSHTTKASSHFVIGIDGEIVQCIPTWEIAYASNERNKDTVSIECCHLDESGEFTKATYQSMVQLTAWLCQKFELDESAVIRHYDVTGKICPKYFVENEEAWEIFRQNVKKALQQVEG